MPLPCSLVCMHAFCSLDGQSSLLEHLLLAKEVPRLVLRRDRLARELEESTRVIG